jgi:hypothetical protein
MSGLHRVNHLLHFLFLLNAPLQQFFHLRVPTSVLHRRRDASSFTSISSILITSALCHCSNRVWCCTAPIYRQVGQT